MNENQQLVIKEIKRRGYTKNAISPNRVNFIANEINIHLLSKEVIEISDNYEGV